MIVKFTLETTKLRSAVSDIIDIEIGMEDNERPCLWNRIWMRLFFGWKFEKLP